MPWWYVSDSLNRFPMAVLLPRAFMLQHSLQCFPSLLPGISRQVCDSRWEVLWLNARVELCRRGLTCIYLQSIPFRRLCTASDCT